MQYMHFIFVSVLQMHELYYPEEADEIGRTSTMALGSSSAVLWPVEGIGSSCITV